MEETSSKIVKSWEDLKNRLNDLLNEIHKEETNLLNVSVKAIDCCSLHLKNLLETTNGYSFEGSNEILFYKEVKPHFIGRLLHYSRLYEIEMDRPIHASLPLDAYFLEQIDKIGQLFERHKFIYHYIRSGSTYLDERLFFHQNQTPVIGISGTMEPADGTHQVCYDYVVGQIKAAESLQSFLKESVDEIRYQRTSGSENVLRVTWTDSKTGLIELAYALQSTGVLNNGKIDLKEVIDYLQQCFHINLGNYPRTFQEILSRKTGYTNFIDRLKEKLLLRIQRIEGRYDK